MYLSRLILNLRSRQVRRDLAKPYEMHRTISRAFPDKPQGGYGRILWRLDRDRRNDLYMIIVQSDIKPDWSRLLHDCGDYLDDVELQNPASKQIDDDRFRLPPGTVVAFRLRANPTRKTETTGKKDRLDGKPKSNGKRVAFVKEEDQIEWLQRRAQRGGFKLVSVNAVQEDSVGNMVKGIKTIKGTSRQLSLLAVRFDGVLQVLDADAFLGTIRTGIGPGKAMGFGMLSLAPA